MTCQNQTEKATATISENGTSPIPLTYHCSANTPVIRLKSSSLDFMAIDREIREFMSGHGIKGRIPTYLELRYGNCQDLERAIRKYGGAAKVASRIGLMYVPQRRMTLEQFGEFHQVLSDIRNFIEENHLDGRMPLHRELRREGLIQLARSILWYGGFRFFADWMGIKYDPHPTDETPHSFQGGDNEIDIMFVGPANPNNAILSAITSAESENDRENIVKTTTDQ